MNTVTWLNVPPNTQRSPRMSESKQQKYLVSLRIEILCLSNPIMQGGVPLIKEICGVSSTCIMMTGQI